METRPFIFLVLIPVVVTGIFIWFSAYHNHNNDFTIPLVLSVLLALAFSRLTKLQIKKIVIAVTIGVMMTLIIKIIIDLRFDPTSHNLFPFEIIIDLILILIASLTGVAIGFIYRKLGKRKSFDNS